jgi:uncharacterized protein (DUF4415 family)
MNTKNKKIRYGKVELSPEEFAAKNVKERITIFIDQEVLDQFREQAEKSGSKYQTLINQALREAARKPSLEERIEALENKIKKVAS